MPMNVIVHVCCGPCAIDPITVLRQEGWQVSAFFYNPNIHPANEYERRRLAVMEVGRRMDVNVVCRAGDEADFISGLRARADRSAQHEFCWSARLEKTAGETAARGAQSFTTTLLASPYQDVAVIARIGREAAVRHGVVFLDRPLRRGFARSHQISKEWGLYHQDYCGCWLSEEARNQKKRQKENACRDKCC